MEPTGSFCVAFNTSLPPSCPGQALNVWGLPCHVNTYHPVVQQKLLSSTWAQQCLSQQLGHPSHSWELLGHPLPLLMAHSRAGRDQHPRGDAFPQKGGDGDLRECSPAYSWGFFPFPSPSHTVTFFSSLGSFAQCRWAPVPTYLHFSVLLHSPHFLLG